MIRTDAGQWFANLNEQTRQRIVGHCNENFITLTQLFEWYEDPLHFVDQIKANGFGTAPFPVLASRLLVCIEILVGSYLLAIQF